MSTRDAPLCDDRLQARRGGRGRALHWTEFWERTTACSLNVEDVNGSEPGDVLFFILGRRRLSDNWCEDGDTLRWE